MPEIRITRQKQRVGKLTVQVTAEMTIPYQYCCTLERAYEVQMCKKK